MTTMRPRLAPALAHSLLASMLLSSCRPAAPGAPSALVDAWSYDVTAAPRGEVLDVEAVFPLGTDPELGVLDGAERYVRSVAVVGAGLTTPIEPSEGRWHIPACARGCRLKYQFLLGDAAREGDDRGFAEAFGDAVESPPSTWLLRPWRAAPSTPLRFRVRPAPGETFVTGVLPAVGSPGAHEARAANTMALPYSAFGRLPTLRVGPVQVAFLPGRSPPVQAVEAWVRAGVDAVERVYGTFPIHHALLLVRPVNGARVGFGSTMGHSGASMDVAVGSDVTAASLREDWVLIHEMVHIALPSLRAEHHWFEEGLATYVGALARANAGLVGPEAVWREWIEMMPHGLPSEGDEGLDRSPTWGRTYWGGALFCLLADVEIRARTANRRALRDALRAVVRAGGNIAASWPLARVVEVGDAATGVPVLRELHARFGMRPERVDLDALWARLGVSLRRERVTFDDTAPWAAIRRALFEASPAMADTPQRDQP